MNVFSVILISFAAAVDGFFVGLPFGLRGTRFTGRHLLSLSVLNLPVVTIAVIFAEVVAGIIPKAGILGGVVLIISGGLSFFTSIREKSSAKSARIMDLLPVGLALAADSAASSFSLALWMNNPIYLPLLFMITHYFMAWGGNRAGLLGNTRISNRLTRMLPSCVIFLMGVMRLLDTF